MVDRMPRFFVYDVDNGLDVFNTYLEAKNAAEDILQGYRDTAGDDDSGWSDDVDQIVWGEVLGWPVETKREPDPSGRFDDIIEYGFLDCVSTISTLTRERDAALDRVKTLEEERTQGLGVEVAWGKRCLALESENTRLRESNSHATYLTVCLERDAALERVKALQQENESLRGEVDTSVHADWKAEALKSRAGYRPMVTELLALRAENADLRKLLDMSMEAQSQEDERMLRDLLAENAALKAESAEKDRENLALHELADKLKAENAALKRALDEACAYIMEQAPPDGMRGRVLARIRALAAGGGEMSRLVWGAWRGGVLMVDGTRWILESKGAWFRLWRDEPTAAVVVDQVRIRLVPKRFKTLAAAQKWATRVIAKEHRRKFVRNQDIFITLMRSLGEKC